MTKDKSIKHDIINYFNSNEIFSNNNANKF